MYAPFKMIEFLMTLLLPTNTFLNRTEFSTCELMIVPEPTRQFLTDEPALNFAGGWKAWGNRLGSYPTNTDPKDNFIPVRRMFDYVGNTFTIRSTEMLLCFELRNLYDERYIYALRYSGSEINYSTRCEICDQSGEHFL